MGDWSHHKSHVFELAISLLILYQKLCFRVVKKLVNRGIILVSKDQLGPVRTGLCQLVIF